jgi:hypothetical protein
MNFAQRLCGGMSLGGLDLMGAAGEGRGKRPGIGRDASVPSVLWRELGMVTLTGASLLSKQHAAELGSRQAGRLAGWTPR